MDHQEFINTPVNHSEANKPTGFELFLLEPDQKKIEEKIYAGMSNTSDFILNKEDHTMGNLLSEYLKKHPKVLMCGYKVAHPNVPEVLLRVQTDGTISPKEALLAVCKQLIAAYGHLAREFTREWELRKMVSAGNQDQNNNNNGGY
ncbi:DNA-directed RNA polymerase II core subunit [Pestalotiopsis sp. IQ-011]|nr:DNA-directed RNA polymerase II core subunit [Pestalotiopsis sp. 9143b]